MTLGEVQAFNTLAAELIEKGNLDDAGEVLTEAISMLSWCLIAPTPIQTPDAIPVGSDEEDVVIYALEDVEDEDDEQMLGLPCSSQRPEKPFYAFPYVFESAASIRDDEMATVSNREHNFASMTCLFNLGLCAHLKWERNPCKTGLLTKALHFYDQALSLTNVANAAILPSDPVLKVFMAVCSNATHCNTELVNLLQVRLWNARLQATLRFASSDQFPHQSVAKRFFSMSAFFNGFGQTTAQAA